MELINHIIKEYGVKNDRELSDKLGISTPVISRIRNGHIKVSANMIIRIHEVFNIPIKEIKALCNI